MKYTCLTTTNITYRIVFTIATIQVKPSLIRIEQMMLKIVYRVENKIEICINFTIFDISSR